MKNPIVFVFLLVMSVLLFIGGSPADPVTEAGSVPLNGKWEAGFSRKYTKTVRVPGIPFDPSTIHEDCLWYRKVITLPKGRWSSATLELKGARFRPSVYVDGKLAGESEGGMAPVFFKLNGGQIKPGKRIELEISLASLKNVPATDASWIPETDQWRSNISSCLWDDVILHLHGSAEICRLIPRIEGRHLALNFDINAPEHFMGTYRFEISDSAGKILNSVEGRVSDGRNEVRTDLDERIQNWSPEHPHLYTLTLKVFDENKKISDQKVIPLGVKTMEIRDKRFYLNGRPFFARGVTVVWHRWMRTGEGRELGYDTAWFHRNIIQRTKDLGGNYLRFHLGLPPERFLDLCDRYGMAVQFEWSFFHGMPASRESLMKQYRSWLDVAMRHPSVCFVHPYNETTGEQLATAWNALNELLTDYPPLLLEDRDVQHIHKYWWSLFENLGLYYDDAAEFPMPIMVDEFGGNYLDSVGDPGQYTTVREALLRFLGRENTREERLAFQAAANGKVAEYWRRTGAAGISPFCALGSDQDGNNWFLGPLSEGNPKPVWAELAPAFSPRSVSLEIWDRNFSPGQYLRLPVYLFNDEAGDASLNVEVTIENAKGTSFLRKVHRAVVPAFGRDTLYFSLNMPGKTGDYTLKANLLNPPEQISGPVVSKWDFRLFKAEVPPGLVNAVIAVPAFETELREFLKNLNLKIVEMNDTTAGIVLTSLASWDRMAAGDSLLREQLQKAIQRGKSAVMLDVGDRPLGQGYPQKAGDLGPLQGVVNLHDPEVHTYDLLEGIKLKFTEAAEPESHLHPGRTNRELWQNVALAYTRLWNGYRGGLIVPASYMEFSGLSEDAFLAQWISCGADPAMIKEGPYYAYELQGFYEFSQQADDKIVRQKLRDRVSFLVEDAPALAAAINPESPVTVTDLGRGYSNALNGIASGLVPLASAGKNLTRTPVALIRFGNGRGNLVVSQLLTSGRLAMGFGTPGLYGVRYDEVAVQFVLNMMDVAIQKREVSNSK